MRNRITSDGLTVQAIAGTYVVLLGWNIQTDLESGLLGFAIQRTDHTENETYWLRGMKTFPNAKPLAMGDTVASIEQPFQSFQWADYSAKPGRSYTYTVIALYGSPGALEQRTSVVVPIQTEPEEGPTHSVYFNRGAIASQEYARRFQDKSPQQVGQAAYDWLSRGLIEAITRFIGKAADASFSLRVAIYEFQWPEVLKALKSASERGADVKVIYDAIENAKEDPVHKNDEAIDTVGIRKLCEGFTTGKIMHNKFIVLLENGEPTEVLTGSTNYTENGIYGHLNCAHIVNDKAVAKAYLDYWEQLSEIPELEAIRHWDDTASPAPDNPPPTGVSHVFSPQTGTQTLKRYSDIAGSAEKALFMTFAFGMNADFLPVFDRNDGVLRFALMDKEGVGKNLASAKKKIEEIQKLPNAVVAIGQNIVTNMLDRWLRERDGLAPGEHVRWVHTKFMLTDPLSDDPVVVTGSANFSDASVNTNHENMLVIRGDKRVADIYLGEFMRQFSSYAFRDAVANAAQDGSADNFKPQFLTPDNSWIERYSRPGSGALRRVYFSGG